MTGTSKTVVLFLEEDTILFQKVRTIFPDVLKMIDNGVFDFKRGQAIIHRDEAGTLRKIDIHTTPWSS